MPSPPALSTPLVVRTVVLPRPSYTDYKVELRYDFYFSCAYCNMAEHEATAIRFTIDHYEPQGARPDLVNSYNNLMYACDSCNQRKGNRCPPIAARQDGYRFFRPDADAYGDHFSGEGVRVKHTSNTGYFTIETLDLNRLELRRLRELRQRLFDCKDFISEGVQALRRFKIDQIPAAFKGRADSAIRRTIAESEKVESEIDSLLRKHAASPLSGDDAQEAARLKGRQSDLNALQSLYPGLWRAPRV